jgi:hypothetical protein
MKGTSNTSYLYQLLALVGWTSSSAGLIPNSRLEVVACGHLFIVTMPRHTAELLRQFVGEA